MKHRFSLAQTALCVFGLAALMSAACGGRYQTIRLIDDDSAGSGGSAPNAGRGGSVSSRAGSGTGGAGIAGTSSGGASRGGSGGVSSSGAGGGGGCMFVKCANPIKCLVGQEAVTEPGQCCPTKCTACPPCPMLKCAAGYHLETAAGECCPRCSPDANVGLCEKGQQEYRAFRAELLNKYSYGCASNSECVLIAPVNLCEQGCSYAVVWYGVADSFDTNLSNAADMTCSSCPQGPIPPCAAPPTPKCVAGQCAL